MNLREQSSKCVYISIDFFRRGAVFRRVFRTLTNIHDRAFLRKLLTVFSQYLT